jgi:hypothetical protein
MGDFNRYRIYCETEVKWVEDYADTVPTVCPNNPAHTVRADSAAELDSKRIILVPDSDGQGILGGETGVGDEMERVIGATRIEKSTADTVPALVMQCSTGHPTGYGCLQLDMDVDGPALDIDSEATGYPLINLQQINGNSRGDIAFGTSRISDPSSPSEGDFWFDGATHSLKYMDDVGVKEVPSTVQVLWSADGSGHIYPKTATDDIYIGGATPNAVLFDDGDAVFGAAAMTGSGERLRVVGSQLIDQNGNAVGLDIDSEATGSPLITLQGLNTNTRGDIAFGTARTADPTTPSEGDFWYQSTDGELKFRKSAATVEVRDAIKLQGRAVASTAPTNSQVIGWNDGAGEWQPQSSSTSVDTSEVTATATTTTTSTTDVLVGSMTTTPAAATYLVWFAGSVTHGTNNANIYISIYAGGTQVAASEILLAHKWASNGDTDSFMCIARVTVNGSQTIEGRWRTSSGTATMYQRTMTLVKST